MAASWGAEARADRIRSAGPESVGCGPPISGTRSVALRGRASDSNPFLELYRAHFAYVWQTARRLGVTPQEVDDVVQETFLAAHRLLGSYEPQGSERAWLFSLAFRVVQHHRRSHRRRPELSEDAMSFDSLPGPSASAPDRGAETSERVRILEEILDRLEPDRRAVLILAELEEKSLGEIAELLGINVNTVASRLRLAREHVEAALARHRARDGWRYK